MSVSFQKVNTNNDWKNTNSYQKIKDFASGGIGAIGSISAQIFISRVINRLIGQKNPTDFPLRFALPNQFLQKIVLGIFLAPVIEEGLCRYAIQDLLLKQKVGQLIPLDGKVGTAFRIAIGTLFFALMHINPQNPLSCITAILVIPIGISSGIVKETQLGFMGAVGAHTIHNVASLFISCFQPVMPQPIVFSKTHT